MKFEIGVCGVGWGDTTIALYPPLTPGSTLAMDY